MPATQAPQGRRSSSGASSVEVLGFAGWAATIVAYGKISSLSGTVRNTPFDSLTTVPAVIWHTGAFLAWAILPAEQLEAAGVSYYPDK